MTVIDKIIGGGLLAGKKTYIAAAVLILNAVAGWLVGDIGLSDLVGQIATGGGLAFLRAGVEKSSS